jgi:hypothetical protein
MYVITSDEIDCGVGVTGVGVVRMVLHVPGCQSPRCFEYQGDQHAPQRVKARTSVVADGGIPTSFDRTGQVHRRNQASACPALI